MGRKRAADPEVQYFKYLNRLRAAGRSNMYGAIPYLMRAFGLERSSAFDVVCRWVDAFEVRRAEAAATGTEAAAPAPPKPARAPAPVVVHRPRRPSRAKPPKNRKPLPEVRVELKKPKAGPRKPPAPKPERRSAPRKPAARKDPPKPQRPKAQRPKAQPAKAQPAKARKTALAQSRRAAAQIALDLEPARRSA